MAWGNRKRVYTPRTWSHFPLLIRGSWHASMWDGRQRLEVAVSGPHIWLWCYEAKTAESRGSSLWLMCKQCQYFAMLVCSPLGCNIFTTVWFTTMTFGWVIQGWTGLSIHFVRGVFFRSERLSRCWTTSLFHTLIKHQTWVTWVNWKHTQMNPHKHTYYNLNTFYFRLTYNSSQVSEVLFDHCLLTRVRKRVCVHHGCLNEPGQDHWQLSSYCAVNVLLIH